MGERVDAFWAREAGQFELTYGDGMAINYGDEITLVQRVRVGEYQIKEMANGDTRRINVFKPLAARVLTDKVMERLLLGELGIEATEQGSLFDLDLEDEITSSEQIDQEMAALPPGEDVFELGNPDPVAMIESDPEIEDPAGLDWAPLPEDHKPEPLGAAPVLNGGVSVDLHGAFLRNAEKLLNLPLGVLDGTQQAEDGAVNAWVEEGGTVARIFAEHDGGGTLEYWFNAQWMDELTYLDATDIAEPEELDPPQNSRNRGAPSANGGVSRPRVGSRDPALLSFLEE